MTDQNRDDTRRDYDAPKVIHSEKMEARAVVCSKADAGSCGAGPIQT